MPDGDHLRAAGSGPLAVALERPWRTFWLLAAVGVLIRLIFAATTDGNPYDLGSLQRAADTLTGSDPLALYQVSRPVDQFPSSWPYPPGYTPFVLLSDALASITGVDFKRVVRLPAIGFDVAVAALLLWALRARGTQLALGAAALVLLGPSFIANSGHHGQLDVAAAFFALAAVVVWTRRADDERRWLWAGLLMGTAAATKHPLGIIVLALLPTARNRGEAARLLAVAIAVPLVLLAPWLVRDADAVIDCLTYKGLPGLGGLSLLVQPDFASAWLAGERIERSGLTDALQDVNTVLVLACAAAAFAGLWRRRVDAVTGACVLVLVLWVAGVNFGIGYAIWGLPLFLLAGRLREAAALQALLLVPVIMVEGLNARGDSGWPEPLVWLVYVPCMLALLALSAYAIVRVLRSPAPRPANP